MTETVTTFAQVVAVAFAALIPVINPPGVAPIFLSLTAGAGDAARAAMAARVARHSFVLLVAAMLAGSSILRLFGLSLAEIRMAGGLLVIATAWHLIRAEQTPDSTIVALSPSDRAEALDSRGFYPLTFPVTIGPGSLSIAVTVGAGMRTNNPIDVAALLGAILGGALVSFTVYLCYRFAPRIERTLGAAGTVVVLRLSAFILLSVGVKILCDGVVERFTAGSA